MVIKNYSPEDYCRKLMGEIQSSNLNYLTQETPYSLYITVRKKFTKDAQPYTPAKSSISEKEAGIDSPGLKVKGLEAANNKLKVDLDKKVKDKPGGASVKLQLLL